MSLVYETDSVLVVTGQRGSGKTTLAKAVLDKLPSWVLFDVNHEYHGYGYDINRMELRQMMSKGVRKLRYMGKCEYTDFQAFVKKAWELQNTVVVIEEAEIFFPNKPFPLKGFENYLIHRGRHRGLGLIVVTRRIADLHKDVLSQAKVIVSFYQYLPNDIDYLRRFIGDEALKLKTLPSYHYLVWSQGKTEICPPVR